MDALENILHRVSARTLAEPFPSKEEMNTVYKAALRAPDHAWLRTSSFIEVKGKGLDKLSDIFVNYCKSIPDISDEVLDKTNSEGVDLIIDQLSGYTVNQNMLATKIKGNIVNVGRLAGGPSEFNCDIHALRRINYKGVTFRTRSLDEIRKVFKDMWNDLSNVVSNGTLSMPIEKVFDFKDVSLALAHMRDNKHFGKLILKL